MDQPPPPPGSVAHPGAAAAASAVAHEASSVNIGRLMGQLLHGYLLADTTGNPPPIGGDLAHSAAVTAIAEGVTYLAGFTSQTELILFGVAAPLRGTVRRTLESSLEHGYGGLVLNPATENAILPRRTVERLLSDLDAR